MRSLSRAVIRASKRFGRVGDLSPNECTALLEAELIKSTEFGRYVLTDLGWDLARRLERAAGAANADAMADHQR